MANNKILKMFLLSFIIFSYSFLSYATPVKKEVPKNSFEIIQGARISSPIDTKLMQKSIIKASVNLGWTIESSADGEITLKLMSKKSWWLIIKVCYTKNEYWFEYIDSYNLDANVQKNKIHRNYTGRWIPNLEKHIYAFYTKPNAEPRPVVISATAIADDFTNVQGKAILAPLNTDKFREAVSQATTKLGWQITENKTGEITIRYARRGWWVVTKIKYSKDGYNYIYYDSYNLNANIKTKTIHPNYLGRWIPNLEKNIAVNYYK